MPATICDPPAWRATRAAPMTSGRVPYSLDSRTRTAAPPVLTCTTCRRVWFSNTVAGCGGVAAPVTAVPQVATHDWPPSAAPAEPVRLAVVRTAAVSSVKNRRMCPTSAAHHTADSDGCQHGAELFVVGVGGSAHGWPTVSG